MPGKTVLTAVAVIAVAIWAAQVARPALMPASCHPPEILGGHWIFDDTNQLSWVPKFEVAVDTYGHAGSLVLNGNFSDDPEGELTAANSTQVGTMTTIDYLDDGDTRSGV